MNYRSTTYDNGQPADYRYRVHRDGPAETYLGTVQRTGPTGSPRSWIAEDAAGRYAGMHESRAAAGLELDRIARDPRPEPVTGEPIALELEEEELAPEQLEHPEPAPAGSLEELAGIRRAHPSPDCRCLLCELTYGPAGGAGADPLAELEEPAEEELAPEGPEPVPEILEELITNAARILAGELEPSHRYALAQVEKHAARMLEELKR